MLEILSKICSILLWPRRCARNFAKKIAYYWCLASPHKKLSEHFPWYIRDSSIIWCTLQWHILVFLMVSFASDIGMSYTELNLFIPLHSLNYPTQNLHLVNPTDMLLFGIGIHMFEMPFHWTFLKHFFWLKTCNSPSGQMWFLAWSFWNYPYCLCSYCSLPPWCPAVKLLSLPWVSLSCLSLCAFFSFSCQGNMSQGKL